MPKGSNGRKRPADVVSNDVNVMRIATGEEEAMQVGCKAEGDPHHVK